MRPPLLVLLAVLSVASRGARVDPGDIGAIDEALERVGLTRNTARIDRDAMGIYGGERWRLQLFDLFLNDPYKMPDYVPILSSSALSNCSSVGLSVMFASLRTGAGVRRGLLSSPVQEYEKLLSDSNPLANVVLQMYAESGQTLGDETRRSLEVSAGALPEDLNRQVALLAVTSLAATKWRNLALEKLTASDRASLFGAIACYCSDTAGDSAGTARVRFVESSVGSVDFGYLNLGATDIGLVLDSVVSRLTRMQLPDSIAFSCQTPLGVITLGGKGNDRYHLDTTRPHLLLLDLGGNDEYLGAYASNLDPDQPISLLIDLGGDDVYLSDGKGFGGASLGYAFLVDLEGDDRYRAKTLAQGAGMFGVGMLWDGAGDDTYDGFTVAQGAGIFGLGILVDRSGNDTYRLYQQGQGFGYTKGCGMLIDSAGNDLYFANDTDIVFPSAQTRQHNVSLAQGMGFGKRADFADGHSLAGGLGFLIDGAGDDSYSCGVFGQGCSYWYGVGLLADFAGCDCYRGVWYVQGAGAHFGVAMLWDGAGNDRYCATMNMAQGAGHDFTVGWLIDEAGADRYDAPNLSLGAGNDNGLGLFWDKGGDDTFAVISPMTLGRANITASKVPSLRAYLLCLGVFLHTGGGKSVYPSSIPFAGPRRTWVQSMTETRALLPLEKGVGLDR